MNKNTVTVTQGEDASIELTVHFTHAGADTSSWERTPEHTPLTISHVTNPEGTDLTDITSNLFSDEDLAYKSSIELQHRIDMEALGWKI